MIVKCMILAAVVVVVAGCIGAIIAISAMNYAYEKGGI